MADPVLHETAACPQPGSLHPPGPDRELDITRAACPMTFVRTRLALDAMQPGQVLQVRLLGDEPVRNVPRTAEALGHEVLRLTPQPDGTHLLLLRRA